MGNSKMRILYGVIGEGLGHAVRSRSVIDDLKVGNDVDVVAGGKAYGYLSKHYKVDKIKSFRIVYRKNEVRNVLTFFYNLFRFPFMCVYNLKLWKYKPDLVISDFEPFTHYYGLLRRKPVVCIDNQHMITNTSIKFKGGLAELFSRIVVRLSNPFALRYLVTTFFYPKVIRSDTELFPPIVRKEVLGLKSAIGDHVLVYQTSDTNDRLLKVLSEVDCKFVVYGFDKDAVENNVSYKKFDESKFLSDLGSCKAVIVNGGFTVLSEALYLRKPVLCNPIAKQFEQVLNAKYIEELGYGKCCEKVTVNDVDDFVSNLSKYRKNLLKYKGEDNSRLIGRIEGLV